LALCHFREHSHALVEELVDDAVLGFGLEVLEGMLR
jgi:hypothetical protein